MIIERLEILTDEKKLHARAQKISKWAGDRLGHKLIKFIAHDGIECAGLAATQVGINKRVFIMFDGKEYAIFVNPRIVETGPMMESEVESCLSIPDKKYMVRRPAKITVKDAVRITPFELTGWTARVWLHEFDHLNGILISDKSVGTEVTEESKQIRL